MTDIKTNIIKGIQLEHKFALYYIPIMFAWTKYKVDNFDNLKPV